MLFELAPCVAIGNDGREGFCVPITRRVFVSMPSDSALTPSQNAVKRAIVAEISAAKLVPEVFFDPQGGEGLVSDKAWTAGEVDRVMKKCVGIVLVGLPRWKFTSSVQTISFASEFCHYEGAVAYSQKLPMLVLAETGVLRRVVFNDSFNGRIGEIPANANSRWVRSKEFKVLLTQWLKRISERRDVFLGYCGASDKLAQRIKKYLIDSGASVLDWKTDFSPGSTILNQITEAASRCSAGVFLFTKDDVLAGRDDEPDKAAPRDNVVFEAGYFVAVKGGEQVLIIREKGAKMPADLGGNIYLTLDDKNDIRPLRGGIKRFLDGL